MQGKRVYPPAPSEDYPDPLPYPCEKGDYWFDTIAGFWMACCPTGAIANLSAHTVVEYDDKTITVSPSILINAERPNRWHGYLEHGIWREV